MPERALRVGQSAHVQALRLNTDGDGVATIDGMTVFVPNLLPNESATVRVTQVEKRFARAVVLSHDEEAAVSPYRSTPECPIFELCGGCQLQHFSYAEQLKHKRSVVEDALRRIGHLEGVTVRPTLGMTHPWRYRNQVQVPLHYDEDGRRYVSGFFAAGSHDVIPSATCHLISEAMQVTLQRIVEQLSAIQRRVSENIGVHHLILRESRTTKSQLIVFVIANLPHKGPTHQALQELWDHTATLPFVDTVAHTVQPKQYGPVWGKTVQITHGSGLLEEDVLSNRYLISPRSFFQTNTEQTRTLYGQALAMAQLSQDDVVVDAYSGAGTMSLLFARQASEVVGIESVAPAVADAKRNAEYNEIQNATFHVGLVEHVLPRLVEHGFRPSVAVVDPPRKGCEPGVLDALLKASPRRIVYVSCNPATLARDLARLVQGGYVIQAVQPVDMFPQTSHVECVVELVD